MSLNQLFEQPSRLPVVPKVVQQLMQSLGRTDVATTEIAAELDADPVLSAKVLRLANSAYFRASRQIGNVQDAILMLGFTMVRSMVMGVGISSAFAPNSAMNMPRFWRYSLQTACASRWLAQSAGEDGELAFTVGLFHGLGHLVMHSSLSKELRRLDTQMDPLALERADAERAMFGYHHGEVSAQLARCWNFPASISEALRSVPYPLADAPPQPIAAWVHVGAWRARVELFDWDIEHIQATCPRKLGLVLQRPFAWQADDATLACEDRAQMRPMPPMPKLIEGLESLLG